MFQNKCAVKRFVFFPPGNLKWEPPRHFLLQLSSIQLSLITSEMLRLFGWFLSVLLKLEYLVHFGADREQQSRFLLISLDFIRLSNTLLWKFKRLCCFQRRAEYNAVYWCYPALSVHRRWWCSACSGRVPQLQIRENTWGWNVCACSVLKSRCRLKRGAYIMIWLSVISTPIYKELALFTGLAHEREQCAVAAQRAWLRSCTTES